jgi:hypothetical protein
MSTSAVSSALSGISSAETMFDDAAQAAARMAAPDADPTQAVVGTIVASEDMDVSVDVLRMALGAERSLIDIFA